MKIESPYNPQCIVVVRKGRKGHKGLEGRI